ncbi:hypothetical protein [Microseira wollei]|uniref:hypothetical protein n=1 Tax=Microseira wollei TaxID=467598 RepID=UPI001CFF47D3|nr:hypothetical protein [Microseira wollei]
MSAIGTETGFLGKIVAKEPEIPARNPVAKILVGKSWICLCKDFVNFPCLPTS